MFRIIKQVICKINNFKYLFKFFFVNSKYTLLIGKSAFPYICFSYAWIIFIILHLIIENVYKNKVQLPTFHLVSYQSVYQIRSINALHRNVKAPNSTTMASYHSDFPVDRREGEEWRYRFIVGVKGIEVRSRARFRWLVYVRWRPRLYVTFEFDFEIVVSLILILVSFFFLFLFTDTYRKLVYKGFYLLNQAFIFNFSDYIQ